MEDNIRILMAEDVIADAELIERELRKGGISFTSRRVYAADTFLKEMDEFLPDIILTDYSMPSFTGMDALKLAKERYPLIPVIMITGSINEETAVECMKAGTDDYLIKEHLARLPSAVESVLENRRTKEEKQCVEEALSAAGRQWRTTFDSITDAVCLISPDNKITRCNKAMQKFLEKPWEEIIGQTCWEIVHRQTACLDVCPYVLMRKSLHRENSIFAKDGRWYQVSIDPEIDEENNFVGAVHIISDITERKLAEEKKKEYSEHLEEMVDKRTKELRDAQERLIRRERLAVLGKLAGSVGHELRNPLGVINNAVYYLNLLHPDADGKTKEYFDLIESEVKHSVKIVADLLNLSRTKTMEKEHTEVLDLISEMFDNHPPPQGVKVTIDVPSDLPSVFVDRRQIKQVLANLITNAYQAMPEGGNAIIATEGNKSTVHLSITDTGCGIVEEDMNKLFEPLFTTKERGIGLGLSVSKSFIELNGGTIEVESEDGKGSKFTATLPTSAQH